MNRGYRSSGNRSSRNTSRRGSRDTRRSRVEESRGPSIFSITILLLIIAGAYLYLDKDAQARAIEIVTPLIERFMPDKGGAEEVPTYGTACTQANIAKILVNTLLVDEEEQAVAKKKAGTLETAESKEAVGAGKEEIWYSKYYNTLKTDSRFSFFQEENALKPITFAQTSTILQNILGNEYAIAIDANEQSKDKNITLRQFLQVYEQALTKANLEKDLHYETISIVATPATNETLKAWTVATDKGIYGFEGLILDSFKDYTLKVLARDNEILGVVETISDTSQISKCYISEVREESALVKIAEKELTYKNKVLTKQDEGKICTLTVKNGEILNCEVKGEEAETKDTVLRITETYIELKEGGKIPYKNISVYDTRAENKISDLFQIASGTQVEYLVEEGQIQALKIIDKPNNEQIRVVISQDMLNDYSHEDIGLLSEQDYEVFYNGQKGLLPAKTPWQASKFSWEKGVDKILFIPKGESSMKVTSLKRQNKVPSYIGTLEIYKEKEDSFTLVNSLGTEAYIAGVIGSEMPTQYGIEAAKVQAVAARSYAMAHQSNSKFTKYGAQVDDTTASQVYNNVPIDEIAKQAAEETKGQVLTYNDAIISGNFFSTSCGYTANFGEVWADGDIYPSNTPVYLVARQQYVGDRVVKNMADEKEAYSFFTTKPNAIDAFDNHAPWFRWQLKLTQEELGQMINSNVSKLIAQYPTRIQLLNEKEEWEAGDISEIGKVENLKVHKRGQGGNIMELIVEGSDHTIKVSTEYLIRCLLAPVQKDSKGEPISILRGDGTTVDNMSMLPSAFFSMDISYDEKDAIKELQIYGGGFGHGVGMSQEGVKGMTKRGYNYKDVLRHYYPEASIMESRLLM